MISLEETGTAKIPAKWVGITLGDLGKNIPQSATFDHKAIYTSDSDVVLDNGSKDGSFVKATTDARKVVLWVKAEEGTRTVTLYYNISDTEVEKLVLTLNIYNSAAPSVVSAKVGTDVNAKGVKVTNKTDNVEGKVTGNAVTVDTYKYAMDNSISRTVNKREIKGRWYSLILKTNLPVSSLVYKNEENKWVEPEKVSDDEIRVWVNEDTFTTGTVIKLANKYVPDNKKAEISITVNQTEKSALVSSANDGVISNAYTIRNESSSKINNIDTLTLDDAKALARNNAGSDGKDFYPNDRTGIYELKLNVAGAEKLTYNGVKARWTIVYVLVSNDSHIVNDTKNSTNNEEGVIYVDYAHATSLIDKSTTDTKMRVPVWVNLDAVSKTATAPTKFTITSSEEGFVEETRDYSIYVTDTYSSTTGLTLPEPNDVGSVKELVDIPEDVQGKQTWWTDTRGVTLAGKPQESYLKAVESVVKVEKEVDGNVITMKVYGDFANKDNFKVVEADRTDSIHHYTVPLYIEGLLSSHTGWERGTWIKGFAGSSSWRAYSNAPGLYDRELGSFKAVIEDGTFNGDVLFDVAWEDNDFKAGATREIYVYFSDSESNPGNNFVPSADDAYIKIVVELCQI